ncbi:hypothetical protein HMPREF1137_0561 [Actinomyces sp. ICM39]|nr:hypothetical protein HMPREF1137_0561 [Actinomyces sp. ICM39]
MQLGSLDHCRHYALFSGRGATTLLADPLLDIRSPLHAGDSCGLAYCISDLLRADNTPDFHPLRPRPRQ